jgi:DnaJ homolog subfamily A member 2
MTQMPFEIFKSLAPRMPLLPFVSPSALCSSGFRYEILNDPNTREIYDSHGMQGLAGPGGPQGGPDMGDFFAQFFGGAAGPSFSFDFGGSGGSFRKRNKEDSVIPYEVSLEDLYNGKTVKVNMEKQVECGVCKG